MKNLDYNQIINLEIIGEEDKDKKIGRAHI